MQNPYEPMVENFPKNDIFKPKYDEMAADLRTPETLAEWFAQSILAEMLYPRSDLEALTRQMSGTLLNSELKRYAEYVLDGLYGFANAKRDLEIDVVPELAP